LETPVGRNHANKLAETAANKGRALDTWVGLERLAARTVEVVLKITASGGRAQEGGAIDDLRFSLIYGFLNTTPMCWSSC
jgi:hypothetical protein